MANQEFSANALEDYGKALADEQDTLLTWWWVGQDRSLERHDFSRGEMKILALTAARLLSRLGIKHGDRVVHGFSGNHYLDLVFRLGASLCGGVPVTVNWEADTIERICFKISHTKARLLIYDTGFAANCLTDITGRLPLLQTYAATALTEEVEEVALDRTYPQIEPEDEKIIIFTSGTTGLPKGVSHDYQSYAANAATFEDFFSLAKQPFTALVTSALHHANATAICDWCLRKPLARLHLVSRYSTGYWRILKTVVDETDAGPVIAPVVSRHFDILASLIEKGELPLPESQLWGAMARTRFLIGSAPVGPTTVNRIMELSGQLPTVRFGSSETCLQVLGIPQALPEEVRLAAFRAGWVRETRVGYYIGRPHPGHTEVRVVASIGSDEAGFMEDVAEGEPGYLITRGQNVMTEYVGDPEATARVLQKGWYLGLQDIGFYLNSPFDGERDFYWMSRQSTLLIKGGANYAYDQINSELLAYLSEQMALPSGALDVAVVGLRLGSEHEDTACVTVCLHEHDSAQTRNQVEALLTGSAAKQHLTKGARPDRVRFGPIPRNFKGAVVVAELKKGFTA